MSVSQITQRLLRLAWLAKMSLRERSRWRQVSRDESNGIRVYYGHDRLPLPDEQASGGIIKCQDLQALFPNDSSHPNLLYLISSALPPHVSVLVAAARRAGAPIVLNQNGVAYPAWHGAGWEETNRTLAIAHSAANHIFYQSRFCQQSAERFLGKRSGQCEVLYNPVDTKAFSPGSSRALSGDPVLLTAGSHHSFRHVQIAMDVLRELTRTHPFTRLLIAGRLRWKEPEELALKELQESLRGSGMATRVQWLGAYSQKDAPELLRSADILLHVKYNDACPRLIVEAMACGVPVVHSSSGGVPELVGEKAGAGVPAPCDWNNEHSPAPGALADAVSAIMSNYMTFSSAARERAVTCFDVRPWIERHQSVFTKLLRAETK